MIRETLNLVKEEFSGQEAFNDVARIASFHRIQLSPGLKDAARFIHSHLAKAGIQCELLSFPARKGVKWWSQESFQEWKANDAELVLLEDGKRETLCAFSEFKTSLIQRSAATPPEGIETTMVLIENAEDPKSYEGMDVAGKLVLSRGNVSDIAKVAVDQFGAAGIVVDTMREQPPVRDRFDLPDGRQYLSFWPADAGTHRALGFVVTPRQGEALRRRFAEKKELSAFARVDVEFSDGTWEIPTAIIPGESDEVVVAVAHLCHPEQSANDNASGCGTLMETARALSKLIATGRLQRPKRSIRFLWVPEMTGSYAFLATHEEELKDTVAAINLDMVGQNQELCGSTFTVERPVSALPGFGGDLAATILGLMTKEVGNLAGTSFYSTFRWAVCPFSGGSDHNIWGDPSVGVTCPMLIQWPDKFYHTSEDTIDKVDPHMLKVTGVLTATYVYTAACATPCDAALIAGEAAARFAGEADGLLSVLVDRAQKQLAKSSGEEKTEDILAKARRSIELRAAFLVQRKKLDVSSLCRIVPDSPMFSAARAEAENLIDEAGSFLLSKTLRDLAVVAGLDDVSQLPPVWQPEETEAYKRAKGIVPKRPFRGPFSSMCKEIPPDYEEKAKALREKHGKIVPPRNCLEYWADGKRTLADIAHLIESETGFYNMDALVDYFDLMAARGVFEK